MLKTATCGFVTTRDSLGLDVLFELLLRIRSVALDTALTSKTTVSLNDRFIGYSSFSLQAVDVSSEGIC
jgi:hypothetical protein